MTASIRRADPRGSHAVLIGVSAYTKMDRLPAVVNNLRDLAALLKDPTIWGLPAANCHVVLDPVATEDVLGVIHEAARLTTDTLLIYYAGHGLLGAAGDLRLVLRDGDMDHGYRTVRFDDARELLLGNLPPHVAKVVILDCCYSGAADLGAVDVLDDVADRTTIEGTYVMTATTARRRALAGAEHTVFSGTLLRAIRDGIPGGPPLLSMELLYQQVARVIAARGQPAPQQRSRGDGHRIVIVRNRWSPPPPPSVPTDSPEGRWSRRRQMSLAALTIVLMSLAGLAAFRPWRSGQHPQGATAGATGFPAMYKGLSMGPGLGEKAVAGRLAAVVELGGLARATPTERSKVCTALRDFAADRLPFPKVAPWYDQKLQKLSYRAADVQAAIDQLGGIPCPAVKLPEADLRVARLVGDFQQADLSYASLFKSDITRARLDGATLTGAHLQWMNGVGASLVNANMDGAEIADTTLTDADLRGATFRTLTDRRTKFYRAKLSGADLRGAHLEGADLSSAVMDATTRLQGATADGETDWPPQFDSRKVGVRY